MNRTDEMKELMENKVLELARNFKNNPNDVIEYLKFQSKFYNYSNRNCTLIYKQNPGALCCNSYKRYQEMGYQVKKGEHGMKILVPVLKKFIKVNDKFTSLSSATAEQKKLYKENKLEVKEKLFFKIGTVFDISQTTCPTQDYPKYIDIGYNSEKHAELFNTLKSYCEKEFKCPVHENAFSSVSLRGYYEPETNQILISGNFDDTTKLSVLSHELGHAVLHKDVKNTPNCQIEFEADAYSIMLQHYCGIEIPESRIRHCAENLKLMCKQNEYEKQVQKSLDTAHTAFKNTVNVINKELRPEMTKSFDNNISPQQNNAPQSNINQQPILPCQIPNMGIGGMSFS